MSLFPIVFTMALVQFASCPDKNVPRALTAWLMAESTADYFVWASWDVFKISVRPVICPMISGPASPATNTVP